MRASVCLPVSNTEGFCQELLARTETTGRPDVIRAGDINPALLRGDAFAGY
jgi:hypothetical protein